MSLRMIKVKVRVIVERDDDEFYAFCPDLRGIHTGGPTEESAATNAFEAARLYLISMLLNNEPIPIGVCVDESWSFDSWIQTMASARRNNSDYIRDVELSLAP